MNPLVNVVIPPLRGAYTYELTEKLSGTVDVGYAVEVPLGSRKTSGFVVSRTGDASRPDAPTFKIKSVLAARSSHRLFDADQLKFFQWVADYYSDALANVIDAAIPPSVPQKFSRVVRVVAGKDCALRGRVEQQLISELRGAASGLPYELLSKRSKGAAAALRRLHEKGYIAFEEHEILDQHLIKSAPPAWAKQSVALTEAQELIAQEITASALERRFQTFLLHGVTGSGKTEVYIEVIERVARHGLGALVIVPEIALTPQLIDRFQARFGSKIAVLHSALQPRARWDGWRALLEGRCALGIGARSAIFAPLPALGVIIVDEEHDTSYKQAEGLRYNARDLAVARGKFSNCPVVLGSATPSLESFHNAQSGRYRYQSLAGRPQTLSATEVRVVDLALVKPWEMVSKNIAPQLFAELSGTLERKEQAFILYNRRGFARYLQCEKCEAALECPNCSVTLTYHRNLHSLLCHYCGLQMVPPELCPRCPCTEGATPAPGTLVQRGAGTEKVFEELRELFPQATIDRLDRDAASDSETYRKILDRVRNGETSILVGTQMIAKGHDLPGVTLVGIVDCDVGLHMPDFRAGERVFQLLTQASGRAGRGNRPGVVLLQTRVPKHPSIVCTEHKDFVRFATQELRTRQALDYPPFTRVLRVVASSLERSHGGELLHSWRGLVSRWAESHNFALKVLGPSPAPLERLRAQFRWHLLFKSASAATLNRVMQLLQEQSYPQTKVRVVYDLDPQDML